MMAGSTEEAIRERVVNTIRAIAETDLGFDNRDGNIHGHLLEFEQEENWESYLSAEVGGRKRFRAWGVQVTATAEPIVAANKVSAREYLIQITGYYEKGVNGEGVNELIKHSRAIRREMLEIYCEFDEKLGVEQGAPQALGAAELISATLLYSAKKKRPDF